MCKTLLWDCFEAISATCNSKGLPTAHKVLSRNQIPAAQRSLTIEPCYIQHANKPPGFVHDIADFSCSITVQNSAPTWLIMYLAVSTAMASVVCWGSQRSSSSRVASSAEEKPHGWMDPSLSYWSLKHKQYNRSLSSSQLVIQCTWLYTVSDRASPVAGSRLWNSLPPYVTSAPTPTVFRHQLKTYLFSQSFPS